MPLPPTPTQILTPFQSAHKDHPAPSLVTQFGSRPEGRGLSFILEDVGPYLDTQRPPWLYQEYNACLAVQGRPGQVRGLPHPPALRPAGSRTRAGEGKRPARCPQGVPVHVSCLAFWVPSSSSSAPKPGPPCAHPEPPPLPALPTHRTGLCSVALS